MSHKKKMEKSFRIQGSAAFKFYYDSRILPHSNKGGLREAWPNICDIYLTYSAQSPVNMILITLYTYHSFKLFLYVYV